MIFVKASDLRLLQGAEDLTDYQHTPPGKADPFLHFTFCRRCGVRPFTQGGPLERFGGEFYAVNVACLDDVTEQELAAVPVSFVDGRHNRWDAPPAEHRYL